MALKKSRLYSSLWQSCDELRGSMDASQYKDYVLTLLFMKYVSDKYAADPGALIEVPVGGGFADMAACKGDKETGDRINQDHRPPRRGQRPEGRHRPGRLQRREQARRGQEMQDRLSKLVAIFERLDFRANRAGGDDLLGDAYEYLMRHFATESGKSKGQFYTPAEVSRIMARVVGIGPDTRPDRTIYDPTCGSGSLLLKAAFKRIPGRRGYSRPRIEARQVKAAILDHEEFKSFGARVTAIFESWCRIHRRSLRGLRINDRPAAVIDALSEDLLTRFAGLPLLSRYDVYQRLMDYWDEAMQDDVHLIAAEGWVEAARPRGIIEDREKNIRETPDLVIGRRKYKMDLAPPALIVARWFAARRDDVEMLKAWRESAARELEEFVEEHGGEGGLLEDAANDKGKVTRSTVKGRLKAIRDEPESGEERNALTRCLALIEAESEAGKSVKEAQAALDEQVLARYATLTEAEIKTLVVEDKWFAGIRGAVDGEVQRLTQGLAGRVKALEERYARPLPELEQEVETFGRKVEGHLRRMGLSP